MTHYIIHYDDHINVRFIMAISDQLDRGIAVGGVGRYNLIMKSSFDVFHTFST